MLGHLKRGGPFLDRVLSSTTVQRCMSSGRRSIRTHQITDGRVLAYRQVPGQQQPTLVVIPGLHSYLHMNGMLAKSMLRYSDMHKYSCVVYDHECIGESQFLDGIELSKILFSHWVEDAISVIENLVEKDQPVVLVGASLGGWLALVAAQMVSRPVHGLMIYGPAINYVYPYFERHITKLPADIRKRVLNGDVHLRTYGTFGDAMLKKDFAEDSRKYEIDLSKPINIDCPVRIVHGLMDSEVKPDNSLQLCKMIRSHDVDLIYRKEGPHQLEAPPDIELFLNTLDRMLKDHPVR